MTPLLQTSNLIANYGDFQALFGINLAVHKGETIALIGSNGAGKTTTLKAITGLIPAPANDVRFMGEPIGGLAPERMNLAELVVLTDGFSGAEIEQGIVSALYAAHALEQEPEHVHIAAELRKTRPLSVIMAERVAALRAWAKGRTVPAE